MEDVEIERKFLWTSPLPSDTPDRQISRFIFPKDNGVERRIQKVTFKNGSVKYRDQLKQELSNGDRKELKKEFISEEEFNRVLSEQNQNYTTIERCEYDIENDDSSIRRITLVHYPRLALSRYEVEFKDNKNAKNYKNPLNLIEIKGILLRDNTLSKLNKEEVEQEISKLNQQ